MRDWTNLRENNRSGAGSKYNLGAYWRGEWYRERPRGAASEARYRAQALAYMLEMLPCRLHPDDEIAGDGAFLLDELPPEIPENRYLEALEAHQAHPVRDFPLGGNHTLPHFPDLLAAGLGGVGKKIVAEAARERPESEKDYLAALLETLRGIQNYCRRYAAAARAAGRGDLAARLERIATEAPATMHEAIQLVWLVFLVNRAHGGAANAFGRVDQYLRPFYRGDREETLRLFCHWWSKIEGLRVGDGANQSNVVNICIGGVTPAGEDAANELSSIALEATRLVRSPSTNLSARFHEGSPDWYHRECAETIISGIGFPAIFNDAAFVPGLEKIGIPTEVARDYCLVGCVETMLPGLQPGWSDEVVNTAQLLERVYRRRPDSYAELLDGLRGEFREAVGRGHAVFEERLRANPPEECPDLLLSLFTRDCVARGRDLHGGGAVYPRFHGVCCLGFGTMADSLAALKKLVYEDGRLTLDRVLAALEADFAGYEYERQTLLNLAPKYGNDDAYVDAVARDLAAMWCGEVSAFRISGGGRFLPLMAANIHNIWAGAAVGATPDGRRAGTPLSTAASPGFGCDRSGPTAFFASVAWPDYTQSTGGVVVNMRFDPDYFRGAEGVERMGLFTREFTRRGIQEMQFNFNNNAELEDAIRSPENYRNLVVRVSGFSAYFTQLPPAVQQDVLRRRAHAAS